MASSNIPLKKECDEQVSPIKVEKTGDEGFQNVNVSKLMPVPKQEVKMEAKVAESHAVDGDLQVMNNLNCDEAVAVGESECVSVENGDITVDSRDEPSNEAAKSTGALEALRSTYPSSSEDSGSDSEPESDSDTVPGNPGPTAGPRVENPSSSSSSDSEEDSESVISDSDDSETEGQANNSESVPGKKTGAVRKSNKNNQPLTPYMDEANALPPVPDISKLKIDADKMDFTEMGTVLSIIGLIVTIESAPNVAAYDMDTLVFVDNAGTPLGFIDDVIGPVTSPIYIVRFNKAEDLDTLRLQVGQKVYCAPKSDYTKYVFLQQVLQVKGSDASWVGDQEVPPEYQDFSDDEQEHASKRSDESNSPPLGSKRSASTSSLERHRRFETAMNRENNINTRIHQLRDAILCTKRPRTNGAAAGAQQQRQHGGHSAGGRAPHSRLITQSSPSVGSTVNTNSTAPQDVVPRFNPLVPPPVIPRAVVAPTVVSRMPPTAFGQPPPLAMSAMLAPFNQCNTGAGALHRPPAHPIPWTGPMGSMMMCVPPPPLGHQYQSTTPPPGAFRPVAAYEAMRQPPIGNGYQYHVPASMCMRPAPMQGSAYPPLNAVGSTNTGTSRFYSPGSDAGPPHHMRFMSQNDL